MLDVLDRARDESGHYVRREEQGSTRDGKETSLTPTRRLLHCQGPPRHSTVETPRCIEMALSFGNKRLVGENCIRGRQDGGISDLLHMSFEFLSFCHLLFFVCLLYLSVYCLCGIWRKSGGMMISMSQKGGYKNFVVFHFSQM